MALYPATLQQLTDRVAKYQYLGRREQAEIQFALDGAQAEMEMAAPGLADGGLTTTLDRAAWVTHLDLAVLRLREEHERDEEGGIPKAMITLRSLVDDRIKAMADQLNGGDYALETMDEIDAVGLPE